MDFIKASVEPITCIGGCSMCAQTYIVIKWLVHYFRPSKQGPGHVQCVSLVVSVTPRKIWFFYVYAPVVQRAKQLTAWLVAPRL